ncbi:hypothetical protein D3C81_1704660 [compost metagenome]
MLVEQLVHQVAQLHVVLPVSLHHLAQTMLGQNQLTRRSIPVVDVEHALFDQPRQLMPGGERAAVDRCAQCLAKRPVHIGGQRLQQGRHAGEEVVHRRRRYLRPLGHAVNRQPRHPKLCKQLARGHQDHLDPGLAAGARLARGGGAAHQLLIARILAW